MGGMKSGTGDVWDDDEDDETEANEPDTDGEAEVESETDANDGHDVETTEREAGFPSGSESGRGRGREGRSTVETAGGAQSSAEATGGTDEDDEGAAAAGDAAGSSASQSDSGKPYVVRRMLKDKSVQFERDERLTLFVHDDVKAGEGELEAQAQELFGRDIPVFDIREAVYRAALRNREDVVDELEEMGYTRD